MKLLLGEVAMGPVILNGQITDRHRAQWTPLQPYLVILTIGVVIN